MITSRDQRELKQRDELLSFFSEEKGLHPQMLLSFLYRQEKDEDCLYGIYIVKDQFYSLIRFYRDMPGLCVDKLLNYDSYAIRRLAVYDKKFLFQTWLLQNGLTMPSFLVNPNIEEKEKSSWNLLSELGDFSGIEYLNRKVLYHPRSQWQNKLNELINVYWCYDKAIVLEDSLVSPSETPSKSNLIEERFLTFKEKEKSAAEKYTPGITSLLWICAKKISKINVSQPKLDELPLDVQCIIKRAKSF